MHPGEERKTRRAWHKTEGSKLLGHRSGASAMQPKPFLRAHSTYLPWGWEGPVPRRKQHLSHSEEYIWHQLWMFRDAEFPTSVSPRKPVASFNDIPPWQELQYLDSIMAFDSDTDLQWIIDVHPPGSESFVDMRNAENLQKYPVRPDWAVSERHLKENWSIYENVIFISNLSF